MRPRRWTMAIAWSTISSKVMADPPPRWHFRQRTARPSQARRPRVNIPGVYQEHGEEIPQIALPRPTPGIGPIEKKRVVYEVGSCDSGRWFQCWLAAGSAYILINCS